MNPLHSQPGSTVDVLAAKILEAMVGLAQSVPQLEENKVNTALLGNLKEMLPREHRPSFNEDMSNCIYVTGEHRFSLTPEAVATNILPHFALFLASMIVANQINYRPTGCPVDLKIEVTASGLATATIGWVYSMAGVELNEPKPADAPDA